MTETRDVESVPAARNALRLIRLLARKAAPAPAGTLARELGLPRSSFYRLARALMEEGFIVHYPEERAYGLSDLIAEIGSGTLRTDRLQRLGRPLLEAAVARSPVPAVCHLAVLVGNEVTYIGDVSSPRAPATVVRVGVRLPAHLAATGRAALAALSHDQVRLLYPDRQALLRRGESGPRTLADLDALLADTRRRGWAHEDDTITAGYASVAATALDRSSRPSAAIGLTYREGATDSQVAGMAEIVVAAATELTHRLAGGGPRR
ncbi:helix-turn-helix domain-containing protein [Microbacterium enclense]|uniref:IclR family transcriptional regulator n=1 Tax=Microbacterium enclense TaxID=993073 RepID=UPI0021A43ECA|nr:IclR family transcriptional regulator C-terminal domain-containing protein [Microbacterium enclense]MCT2085146.1 helix-turn-helix domain-containing protein [Microbacterium enclense]